MKKRVAWIMLIIGIILWILWMRIHQERDTLKQPIVNHENFSLQNFMDSLIETIDVDNLSFVDEQYERFEEILMILQDTYYDEEKIIPDEMFDHALKSFVDAMDDPYTVYMDAEQQSGFSQDLKGEDDFEGIGAVVRKKDYYVLIEELLKNSPAFKAWLQPLDRIVAVDSGSVKDLDITEAVNKIKWPANTDVVLTIERVDRKNNDTKEYLQVTVTREQMLIPSVTSKILSGENWEKIAYIEISVIGEETENLLQSEILLLKKENIDRIIIDLRWNGGWLLPIAVQIASHFIPKDEVVVTAKYRIFSDEIYESKWFKTLEWYPTVVLVDYMTASAGEIIALALQEQIGAKLVGEVTFGKWSIQTLKEFDDGDSIKYTIGRRYAPSGKTIDKIWILPDIEVEFDMDKYLDEGTDNQLDRAIEVVNWIKKQ